MNLQQFINEHAAKIEGVRRENLEQLAAAYLLKTDIPPDEVTLCEQIGPDGVWRWWFEKKAVAGPQTEKSGQHEGE